MAFSLFYVMFPIIIGSGDDRSCDGRSDEIGCRKFQIVKFSLFYVLFPIIIGSLIVQKCDSDRNFDDVSDEIGCCKLKL